jgi:ectoine hydroxylase-related dioxygenase (phytanoyl-CoA dioxygenase family)
MRASDFVLTLAQRRAWREDGFFVLEQFAAPAVLDAICAQVIDTVRADPPQAHPDTRAYVTNGLLVTLEGQPRMDENLPEGRISKVFNPHLAGAAAAFASAAAVVNRVAALYDNADVDVFQSQFIFKNPGAWGQPWHQDSYYFRFDRQPQIGVWLALSEATLENGCLAVLPGSHRLPIVEHVPDARPGANYGYLEIVGQDFSAARPLLMRPGDVLFFHSYLMHRSFDNRARSQRMAMVYHYARTGTRLLPEVSKAARAIMHFRTVFRTVQRS